jgi:hypothetical protein
MHRVVNQCGPFHNLIDALFLLLSERLEPLYALELGQLGLRLLKVGAIGSGRLLLRVGFTVTRHRRGRSHGWQDGDRR